MTVQMQVVALLLGALIVFGTGFGLKRASRPYSTAALTVHKLVDLAVVGLVGVLLYRATPFSAAETVMIAAAGVTAAVTFATGGVISASASPPAWALMAHKVTPWFMLALAGASLATGLG